MYTVEQSETFSAWLNGLRDAMARVRITARIVMAKEGNLGDCEPVGDGIHEMRVHVGPGYRLYFTQRGHRVIFLLLGGDRPRTSNAPRRWPRNWTRTES
jgi:putative addiction module killer protein